MGFYYLTACVWMKRFGKYAHGAAAFVKREVRIPITAVHASRAEYKQVEAEIGTEMLFAF